jgi:hypothetical protein
MTEAQRKALDWLHAHGGDGIYDRHGVLLAGGELAPIMRSTWNALQSLGYVEHYNPHPTKRGRGRLRVITERARCLP